MRVQSVYAVLQTPSDHMRTVVVVAMKFTIVDTQQPVDAHLPRMMATMLDHIQDQDGYPALYIIAG